MIVDRPHSWAILNQRQEDGRTDGLDDSDVKRHKNNNPTNPRSAREAAGAKVVLLIV